MEIKLETRSVAGTKLREDGSVLTGKAEFRFVDIGRRFVEDSVITIYGDDAFRYELRTNAFRRESVASLG